LGLFGGYKEGRFLGRKKLALPIEFYPKVVQPSQNGQIRTSNCGKSLGIGKISGQGFEGEDFVLFSI